MKNAVVLWTGGKDCCLALHLAREHELFILALVTFVPVGNSEFKAHPQTEMRVQAQRMGLAIHFIETSEPYKLSYIEGLVWIRDFLGVSTIITGDIDLVNGYPNWIEECCSGLNLDIFRPLWNQSRDWVIDEILQRGIQARISYLGHSSLPKEWLGCIINESFVLEMKQVFSTISGADLSGENGEYHTMVTNAPAFIF